MCLHSNTNTQVPKDTHIHIHTHTPSNHLVAPWESAIDSLPFGGPLVLSEQLVPAGATGNQHDHKSQAQDGPPATSCYSCHIMAVGFPYGKLESRHRDRQMETTGSALLLTTGSPVDVAPVFGSWTCHLSACPVPYLGFGAAKEGKVESPNQTFYSRLLPLIGPRWRGEDGDEIPVGYVLLVDQLLIIMDHKARVITHAPMTRGH